MDLSLAITQVENASAAYNGAVTQTATDQDLATKAQAKADAAKQTVDGDKVAQSQAASGYTDALKGLISAAQDQIDSLTAPVTQP